jgi:hypothetical protein
MANKTRKRLVEIEWDETSGVDAPANDVPGWAVLKTRTVHHGNILRQIKRLVDGVLARVEEEEDDDEGSKVTKADREAAIFGAIRDAWPTLMKSTAKIVRKHGRSEKTQELFDEAFGSFRARVEEDVAGRLLKLKGTAETVRSALRAALHDKFPSQHDSYDEGAWIRDFDDNDVIYEYDGELWSASYMIKDDGSAQIGDPVRVHVTYAKD